MQLTLTGPSLLSAKMSQHMRATSTRQDSGVLKDKGHFFEDPNVNLLDQEDRIVSVNEYCWNEVVDYETRYHPVSMNKYCFCEWIFSKWGDGLENQVSATYNDWLLPRRFNPHSHLTSGDLNNSFNGEIGQCLTEVSPVDWHVLCLLSHGK